MVFDNKTVIWQPVSTKGREMKRKIIFKILAIVIGIPGSLFLLGGNQGIITAGIILVIVLLPDGTDD